MADIPYISFYGSFMILAVGLVLWSWCIYIIVMKLRSNLTDFVQSLLTVAIPDFLMIVNFLPRSLNNIIIGRLDDSEPYCTASAMITIWCCLVMMTMHVIQAARTAEKFRAKKGTGTDLSSVMSQTMLLWCVAGMMVCFIAANGNIGNYRGLYCCIREDGYTPLVVLPVFIMICLNGVLCGYFYSKACQNVVMSVNATVSRVAIPAKVQSSASSGVKSPAPALPLSPSPPNRQQDTKEGEPDEALTPPNALLDSSTHIRENRGMESIPRETAQENRLVLPPSLHNRPLDSASNKTSSERGSMQAKQTQRSEKIAKLFVRHAIVSECIFLICWAPLAVHKLAEMIGTGSLLVGMLAEWGVKLQVVFDSIVLLKLLLKISSKRSGQKKKKQNRTPRVGEKVAKPGAFK